MDGLIQQNSLLISLLAGNLVQRPIRNGLHRQPGSPSLTRRPMHGSRAWTERLDSKAQDSLEKMLVHEMAVLHRGMMRAAIRMNEELYAAAGLDEGRREAANVRACRLAGAISRLSATYQQGLLTLQRKRTGGNQHVTVKHIHQQVNVTEGGQAVVAGDTVTRDPGERRRGMIEK